MRNMITEDKKSLVIFRQGIEVDRSLPKHVNIDAELKNIRDKKATMNISVPGSVPSVMNDLRDIEEHAAVTPSDWGEAFGGLERGNSYDKILGLDVHGINILMGEKLRTRIFEPDSGFDNSIRPVPVAKDSSNPSVDVKTTGALKRLLSRIKKNESVEGEQLYSLDILQFFSEIKGIAKNSPQANAYIDRTRGYIQALKNADSAGQIALKERLLGGLIMNKYESALYAVGKYYVVEEDQVVEFAKRCHKGLSLTYLKNYLRPLPSEVIDAIDEMNKMEIFDNYVVLHYDPERKSFEETFKEKERRSDPILFGVIKGSKKLYYVADWTDEYCDLTLEKFAEVLQKNKESFKMSEKPIL